MTFKKIEIKQMVYRIPITKDQWKHIVNLETRALSTNGTPLITKLKFHFPKINKIDYCIFDGNFRVHIKTNSVIKYDPSKNPEFWHDVCRIIEVHTTKKEY